MDTLHTDIEEKALDIILSDDLTQQQIDELDGSAGLQACVQDALDVRTVMQRKAEPMDVGARLRDFHDRHDYAGDERPRHRSILLWTSIIAIAAVFIGAFFFITRPQKNAEKEYFFTATNVQDGISLVAQNGDKVTLSPKSKQSSTLTLDDFRQIFADKDNIEDVTLTVPIGKSADIVLPDSSRVSLSPGSRLTFPTAFGSQRVVKLDGSGYFKVRHDASRPFTVLTGATETTVLGTEFAVDSKDNSVTLVSGCVRFNAKGGQRSKLLKPSQQARLHDNGTMTVSEVDTKPYTMWRDGYLYFDNMELRDIMLAIGENFNKTIDFRSTTALHYKMRFITERNAGVSEALRMMNRMDKVHVSLQDNKIIVEDL